MSIQIPIPIIIPKEIKCLTCKSYIHETERCYILNNRQYCFSYKKIKIDCDCIYCTKHCVICNEKNCFKQHNDNRCDICNEFLLESLYAGSLCRWDHTRSNCKYCNLPIDTFGSCLNGHNESYTIKCKICDIPINPRYIHDHDGNKCRICNTLLNCGRCIKKCIGGGQLCIYCDYEGIFNNTCLFCDKDNTGQLTKRAKKNV